LEKNHHGFEISVISLLTKRHLFLSCEGGNFLEENHEEEKKKT
jgi:hypothetical protein